MLIRGGGEYLLFSILDTLYAKGCLAPVLPNLKGTDRVESLKYTSLHLGARTLEGDFVFICRG